ncbi:hypothetical protein PGTUg99_003200 [Puccinia graminis f. sp. tritici]|uniref:Uncharacterized protein n=1 Tax=Puccinia graminis f. sp. tritici TaxID=56615 RepID=A0A5B0QJX9_PUCGR|nr:hypothetical protein PGTUg99_003200 [Puccinia graminis f. sp. tritici]
MLDATHNTVNNHFLSNGKKVSLYTFLIRDPIVGKGLPIAWAFTASAAEKPLAVVLQWLRDSTGMIPQSVMSDCALAIANAVSHVYQDLREQAPRHYWCLFHVLKAFKGQTTTYVRDRSEEAFKEFRSVVYSHVHPITLLNDYLAK